MSFDASWAFDQKINWKFLIKTAAIIKMKVISSIIVGQIYPAKLEALDKLFVQLLLMGGIYFRADRIFEMKKSHTLA